MKVKGVGKYKIQQEKDITEEEPKETNRRGKAKGKKDDLPRAEILEEKQKVTKGRGKAMGKKVLG